MKMQPYRFFYAIQPRSLQSRWFDSLIKVDVKNPNGIFVHNVLFDCSAPTLQLQGGTWWRRGARPMCTSRKQILFPK